MPALTPQGPRARDGWSSRLGVGSSGLLASGGMSQEDKSVGLWRRVGGRPLFTTSFLSKPSGGPLPK